MLKPKYIFLIILCVLSTGYLQAQRKFSTLIQSSNEDEIIVLSVDKPVYYPGDTVSLTLKRNERTATVVVTPVLIIEGTTLKYIVHNL
jgi:NAD(P)H-hydrate repair Nnr-like enzyme with NAD(P)H-hydrate epimerase domain